MNKIVIGIAFLGLFAFGIITMLATYSAGGIYWDFIAHMLFAKSFLAPSFYSALQSHTLAQAANYQNAFYYEYYRAPLMSFVLLPLMAAFGQGVAAAYATLLIVLLMISVFYVSRGFKMDPWVSLALFANPYVLIFLTLLNGSEILAMVMLLLSVWMISRNRWQAGIFMALAGLSKFPSLVFLPLLFMLKGRDRHMAILSFILVTLPWLAFNFYAFSNPFFGYTSSLSVFGSGASALFPIGVVIASLCMVLGSLIPAAVLFGILAYYVNREGRLRRPVDAKRIFAGPGVGLALALLILGIIGFAAVSLHSTLDNLPRLGYLLYIGAAILLAFGISRVLNIAEGQGRGNLRLIVYAAMFFVYAVILAYTYAGLSTHYIFNGYGSNNLTVLNAVNTLDQKGLGSCNIVSNAWVYLRFQGVSAHSPFYYNATVQRYPILLFGNIGVPASTASTRNVSKIYNYQNYTIDLPENYTCG